MCSLMRPEPAFQAATVGALVTGRPYPHADGKAVADGAQWRYWVSVDASVKIAEPELCPGRAVEGALPDNLRCLCSRPLTGVLMQGAATVEVSVHRDLPTGICPHCLPVARNSGRKARAY